MKKLFETIKQNLALMHPAHRQMSTSLGMPSRVEERIPLRFARIAGTSAAVMVFAGVGWSALASMNEVSVARGALVPVGMEQTIQHLEGGIVHDIFVEEGQIVEKGAPLLILRDASTIEDSLTLARQDFDLRAQLEVQRALAEKRAPDFGFIPEDFTLVRLNNRDAYRATLSALEAQEREYESQRSQAEFALEAIRSKLRGREQVLADAKEDESRFQRLLSKGVTTRSQFAEKRRLRVQAEVELEALTSNEKAAQARLAELQRRHARAVAEEQASRTQRILALESTMTNLSGSIAKKASRKERLTVAAPIRGVVKDVAIRGPGAVVQPGDVLATLVPLDKPLIAEARVPADQIGYLRVGQPAQLKLSAFDFTRYGWLDGNISKISPSAFDGDEEETFYRVHIALADTVLPKAPGAMLLPVWSSPPM